MKKLELGLKKGVIILVVGIICIVVGLTMILGAKTDPMWSETLGTVTGSSPSDGLFSKNYTPTLDYEVKGTRYQVVADSAVSKQPQPGEQDTVMYNPNKPSEAKVQSGSENSYLSWILVSVGVVLSIGSIVLSALTYRKQPRTNSKLVDSGAKLNGFVMNILHENQNNKRGYRVIAVAANLEGKATKYTSDFVIGTSKIATIDFRAHRLPIRIFVDKAKPTKYFVDTSEIAHLSHDQVERAARSTAQSTRKPQK